MISIDEMQEMLSELVDELPEPFFAELNGGVSLLPEAKPNPAAHADDLYILGEYHSGGFLGRAVFLYYGSFERVFGHLAPLALKRELRKTLRHEFRHHIESLAGEDGLILEDKRQLEEYFRQDAARPVKPPGRRMKTVFAKVCGFAVSHFNIPANGQ